MRERFFSCFSVARSSSQPHTSFWTAQDTRLFHLGEVHPFTVLRI